MELTKMWVGWIGCALALGLKVCEFKPCGKHNCVLFAKFSLAWRWKGLENLVAKKTAVSARKYIVRGIE